MTLKYRLRQFYLQSKFYTIFSLFQVVLTLFLILYVIKDYKTNFKKIEVLLVEFLVTIMMISDIILNGFIRGFKLTFFTTIEWTIILSYLITFIYIIHHGIDKLDEQIEFGLMVLRFCLQCIRLGVGVMRIKENNDKRFANNDLSMGNMDKSLNNTTDNKNIVMVDL